MKPSTAKNIRGVLTRRWVKICGGILTLVALFFLLLPIATKYYLTRWLLENGADSVAIEKLWYNPFVGRITMNGLDVKIGEQQILHNSSMVLNMRLISLFNRDIHVERAAYQDLIIDLQQYEDGRWRYGSYTMKGGSAEKTMDSKEEVASTWAFLADNVILDNCIVRLKMVDFEITLAVEHAELTKLSTRIDQPSGTFSFKGQLNDGPVSIQLDTLQIVPDIHLGGTFSIAKFNLVDLSHLLDEVFPTFKGKAGADGKFLFSMESEKGLQVDYDGTIDFVQPDIGNIDFATKAEGLKWQGKVQYLGPENGPIDIETNGQLAATFFELEVPGAELNMDQSLIDLTGKTTVTIDQNIVVKNDGIFQVEDVKVQLPPNDIAEEIMVWKGKVLYDSGHEGEGYFVNTEGTLDLGMFQVDGGEPPGSFATGGDKVLWQGAVGFGQKDSGSRSVLELEGDLSGVGLHADLVESSLRFGQGKVELKTRSTISFGEKLDIIGTSSLALEQFKLFEGESPLVSFDKLSIAEVEGRGGKTIAVKDLLTDGINASVSGNFPLNVVIPEFHMEDVFTEDLVTFSAGELSVKSPLVTAVHNNQELIRFDDLAVKKVSLGDKAKIRAESIHLGNLAFLRSQKDPAKKTALSIGSADLSEFSWSSEVGLQGDTLLFNDLVATVIRDKEGNVNISRQLKEMQLPTSKPKAETGQLAAGREESKGAPFRLREVVAGGKSVVFFEDYTLAVPYITDLKISELKISDLDSSDSEKETNILLTGEFEKRAPLEITGQVSPFKEKPAIKMKLKLKNYPLSSLSAYTVQSVGTALASGQLKLNTKMRLADDELDMKNSIVLKKLETKTIAPELAAELDNQLPISLDSALSILRDSERNISLEIPLNGQLSDLDVGIADILITGLSKAIMPAVSGYLMYALGPYGALAYVGMKAGEKMLVVTLPPVIFVPQATALTEENIKYLERIAKIMEDRPETDLHLCPRVASWEFLTEQEIAAVKGDVVEVEEKNREALLELGQKRAIAVQSHLTDAYSIEYSRLLICDTVIEKEKNAVPAVLPQN